MSISDDGKTALVRASSSTLARTGSQALARRGLRDLDADAHGRTAPSSPVESGTTDSGCCFEDQAQLLFCLDHRCRHDRCPDVPHLDFALIPVEKMPPAALESLVQEGWTAEEYYYVVQNGAGWRVTRDSEVGWEPESRPDGMVLLRTPELLLGLLRGPFFSKGEAEEFAEERKRGDHNQIARLPRIVPHVWVKPDSDDATQGFPVGCSFCAESDPAQYGKACPKRSSNTWYEVLGVTERADMNQIESTYRQLVKEWGPKTLAVPGRHTF